MARVPRTRCSGTRAGAFKTPQALATELETGLMRVLSMARSTEPRPFRVIREGAERLRMAFRIRTSAGPSEMQIKAHAPVVARLGEIPGELAERESPASPRFGEILWGSLRRRMEELWTIAKHGWSEGRMNKKTVAPPRGRRESKPAVDSVDIRRTARRLPYKRVCVTVECSQKESLATCPAPPCSQTAKPSILFFFLTTGFGHKNIASQENKNGCIHQNVAVLACGVFPMCELRANTRTDLVTTPGGRPPFIDPHLVNGWGPSSSTGQAPSGELKTPPGLYPLRHQQTRMEVSASMLAGL